MDYKTAKDRWEKYKSKNGILDIVAEDFIIKILELEMKLEGCIDAPWEPVYLKDLDIRMIIEGALEQAYLVCLEELECRKAEDDE